MRPVSYYSDKQSCPQKPPSQIPSSNKPNPSRQSDNNPTIYNIIQINQFNQNQLFNLSGNGSQNPPTWQPSNESPLTNFLQMPPTTGAPVPGSHFFQMPNAGSQSQPLPSSGMPNNGMNVAQMPPSGMPNTGGLPQSMPATGMPNMTDNMPSMTSTGINAPGMLPANFQSMPPGAMPQMLGPSPEEAQLEQQLTTICIMLIQFIQQMVMSLIAPTATDSPESGLEENGEGSLGKIDPAAAINNPVLHSLFNGPDAIFNPDGSYREGNGLGPSVDVPLRNGAPVHGLTPPDGTNSLES